MKLTYVILQMRHNLWILTKIKEDLTDLNRVFCDEAVSLLITSLTWILKDGHFRPYHIGLIKSVMFSIKIIYLQYCI